jgi:hypothetical protein
MLGILIISLLLMITNSKIVTYFIPIDFNLDVTIPNNCSIIKNNTYPYIACSCNCDIDRKPCVYKFLSENTLGYISFNKPRGSVGEMIEYGYYINNGVNNFKINPKQCNNNTCYPIISYLVIDESKTYIVEITCI